MKARRVTESMAENASTMIFGFPTLSGALLLPDPLEHAVAGIMIATADATPTFWLFIALRIRGIAVIHDRGRQRGCGARLMCWPGVVNDRIS
jgi:hypothetical protein